MIWKKVKFNEICRLYKAREIKCDGLFIEKKKKKHNGYKGTLELIPPKHRIISSKEKTSIYLLFWLTYILHIYNSKNVSLNIKYIFIDINNILGRPNKVTVYEARKRLESKKDLIEENVQNLLLLSSNCLDQHTVDKVWNISIEII